MNIKVKHSPFTVIYEVINKTRKLFFHTSIKSGQQQLEQVIKNMKLDIGNL